MSSTPSFTDFGQITMHPRPMLSAARGVKLSSLVLRRRPTMTQGQALEVLGRAIEYLYDSQVYQNSGALSPSDIHAVEILMRLSREVFVECRDVAPASRTPHTGVRSFLLKLWPEHRAA